VSTLPAHCAPCRKGTPPLARAAAEEHLRHVPGWTLDLPRLRRAYRLPDFAAALAWTNRVGQLAEQENHHPDIHLTGWNQVELVLSTHSVGGLSTNDFVLARALDRAWERFQDGAGSPDQS
jgi:4a-hydroxytetrahydrobiopterin dehydratase